MAIRRKKRRRKVSRKKRRKSTKRTEYLVLSRKTDAILHGSTTKKGAKKWAGKFHPDSVIISRTGSHVRQVS